MFCGRSNIYVRKKNSLSDHNNFRIVGGVTVIIAENEFGEPCSKSSLVSDLHFLKKLMEKKSRIRPFSQPYVYKKVDYTWIATNVREA